ncbi:MAG: hypothetical protein EOO60_01375 [Hymenobacter sp.]|nr:MAG: hypothetical protein EOO60_01375 [Hymenobacter sp.]
MSFLFFPTSNPASRYLPYAQASVTQREQLLAFVRQRLRYHFPTLSPAAWLRALFEFQPMLVLTGLDTVTLEVAELRQLVQHVASSPELPLLDPPIYGLPTLEVAQRWLRAQELLAAALSEVEARDQGPRLNALLTYLGQPYPLAEQIIQAWRWDLPSSPSLPAGLPR